MQPGFATTFPQTVVSYHSKCDENVVLVFLPVSLQRSTVHSLFPCYSLVASPVFSLGVPTVSSNVLGVSTKENNLKHQLMLCFSTVIDLAIKKSFRNCMDKHSEHDDSLRDISSALLLTFMYWHSAGCCRIPSPSC